MTVYVNTALGTPGLHLGNARGTAAAQPKIAAHADRTDIDHARQQRKKSHVVERCHRGRKGNGHDRIDPGESQGMQTVGRRHQFLSR